MTSNRGSRNLSRQRAKCTPVVTRSIEHHTRVSMIRLCSTPILRKNTSGSGQWPSTSLPLPSTSQEDLRLDGYLEYPHAFSGIRSQALRNSCQRP
ncbi:hypothetical protein TNCV_1847791 [Trichonephila clavipes]|nr:hypothetical protein TNCV_1847791 [Trichonephila clavipes]